ncbi:MAG: hypothetical protein E6167_00620 [Varibaculum cambriense]|nr:hypothetical protein [Varibaculum cambriense]MDU5307362.1 hypothetical protein [Varibaculum cambriense]
MLLWRVLQDSYRVLGFDQAIGDAVFEQLVLARIVEPASKADTVRILDELGVKAAHRNTFNNCLQRCAGRDYRSRVLRLVSSMPLKWGICPWCCMT